MSVAGMSKNYFAVGYILDKLSLPAWQFLVPMSQDAKIISGFLLVYYIYISI